MNMKYFLPWLIALAVIALFISAAGVNAATILFPTGGGTGTSTPPVYGQVLVGNAGGTYTLMATSTLGITGGGSGITGTQGQNVIISPAGTEVATSSLFTVPNGNIAIGTTTASQLLTLGGLSGEATTGNRQILINSMGRASQVLNGDWGNSAGEPGGEYTLYQQDGGLTNFIIGATQNTGQDPAGQNLIGAVGNDAIISASSTMNLDLAAGGTVGLTVQGNPATICGVVTHTYIGSPANVGGDMCPAFMIDQVDQNGNAIMRLGGAGAGWAGEFLANSGVVTFGTKTSVPIGFNINGTRVLTVNSTLNSGFGTTTPWGELSASSTSAFPALAIDQHGTGPTAILLGGNVGIGTTSPYRTLSVAGSMVINGPATNSATTPGQLVIQSDGTVNQNEFIDFTNSSGTLINRIVSVGASGDLNFQGIGATPHVAFTNAGNVGIGSTSPYAQLSLGGGNLVLGATTAGGSMGDLFLPKLGTVAGSFLAVDATGKVIATTSPSGGGAVSSVSNADGTLTISPTTGTVVSSLNLAHANTWSALQNFANASSTLFSSTYASSTNLFTNNINLTGTAAPSYSQGKLVYDTDNQSLTFFNNDSNISLQIGQEEWTKVFNNTGSTIANGSSVYINGTSGGLPTIALADGVDSTHIIALGLTTEAITTGSSGYVTTIGVVHGLNTSAFAAGATVYVSTSTPGGLTSIAPVSPYYRYRVGIVTVSDASVGAIHVTPSTAALGNGTFGQLLSINSSGKQVFVATSTLFGLGTNGTVLAEVGGIPTWVATTTFSSPLIYSNGNVTCQTATGSVPGCLSAADWTTFNAKGAGTVTSVGLSDTNSTLTIGSSPVTGSGTITATLNLSHANTWLALQTFTNASSTLFSSSYASSTSAFFGTLNLPNLANGVLHSVGGLISTTLVNLTTEITGTLGINNGGTGTSTPAVTGQVLTWNGTNWQGQTTGGGNTMTLYLASSTNASPDIQIPVVAGDTVQAKGLGGIFGNCNTGGSFDFTFKHSTFAATTTILSFALGVSVAHTCVQDWEYRVVATTTETLNFAVVNTGNLDNMVVSATKVH